MKKNQQEQVTSIKFDLDDDITDVYMQKEILYLLHKVLPKETNLTTVERTATEIFRLIKDAEMSSKKVYPKGYER